MGLCLYVCAAVCVCARVCVCVSVKEKLCSQSSGRKAVLAIAVVLPAVVVVVVLIVAEDVDRTNAAKPIGNCA